MLRKSQFCLFPLSIEAIMYLFFPPSAGVVQWVTQGLTKVLPQPDDKYKEAKETQEEHTEVSYELRL